LTAPDLSAGNLVRPVLEYFSGINPIQVLEVPFYGQDEGVIMHIISEEWIDEMDFFEGVFRPLGFFYYSRIAAKKTGDEK